MLLKYYPDFITFTCYDWKPLLEEDRFKQIIIESFRFLAREERGIIYAFVIMNTHMHAIWQICGDHEREDVQRDFLKYTGQQILKLLRNENSLMSKELIVNKRDRMRQVLERDSLSIPIWSDRVFDQKLDYIHYNPVEAGVCEYPEEYNYSSARFYILNEKNWDFVTHGDD